MRKKRKANISPSNYKSFIQILEEKIFRSWWVILFFLLCYLAYEKTMSRWNREYETLSLLLEELQEKKVENLALYNDLTRQINSQSDRAWVEMTLIKGLGLLPEGQVKVFFDSTEEQK